ncbi:MAG: CDP-diacylglycerol--serine O-phosphatidyltransferase [Syntrophomonas sp.]|uniref:CDP-diacylglycerol--serine O-phosphatidyltransferase n=1 Tax=Syntrophomonas sp. TaxID=2053627 RepID=UPI0026277E11|nr:CDP-diacylglycerol--serine O-phosphatidyltransferase [Syntrophomonas sp.]MDD2509962.1 CDP-diacylglycerol--serine O-phosphatidyltransferase [Syntrophomonas sp.]MDD3878763.1 CDP-diacylglycerol--serine O-phosphatidyltransferase [Syntrophomonas sp.]MDD4626663.1 CDP-diacylglycerol--serine O-phosphatidyltransferase [Syntrophomonas sp.]
MLDLMTKSFANLLTLMNLVFGSMAIISVQHLNYFWAAIFIVFAVVMDGMDGKIARRFGATSELGKELDSLCDLVSFGVAPAVLLYAQIFLESFYLPGLIAVLFFIICGALRLARFNVLNIHEYFLGIPITLAGFILALISLLADNLHPTVILLLIVFLSLMMISNVKIRKI